MPCLANQSAHPWRYQENDTWMETHPVGLPELILQKEMKTSCHTELEFIKVGEIYSFCVQC